MKYACICFATGISVACLVILDCVGANVKDYKNFDAFLTELKSTADSFLDYVTKMQALLCPNQPLCGVSGELESKDVLGTLPSASISINNVSVDVEDISQSVGVCCLSCSCDDSCRQDDNCCPTKQMVHVPDTSNDMSAVKSECIVASSRSYTDKSHVEPYHKGHQYHMISDCFHDKNHTLLSSCQRPDDHALADRVPVTSQLTGLTYWNKPCAHCNADADFLVDWTPNVWIKTIIPYFSSSLRRIIPYPDTYDRLFQLLDSRRMTDIIYTPPEGISTTDQVCFRNDSFQMTLCRNAQHDDGDWLSNACSRFYSPAWLDRAGLIHKNIFCLVCHSPLQLEAYNISCSHSEGIKTRPGDLTALLNYNFEPQTTTVREVGQRTCNCAQMYDPYLKRCRLSFCPAGQFTVGCHCIEPLRKVSGMPIFIIVKVKSNTEESDSFTMDLLRQLHESLTGALETIAQNTTTEVATTLMQVNATTQTYVCIVVALADPGHDTKQAMRPFLDYLDTDNVMALKVGNLGFTASLTTQAKIWVEQDANGQRSFKACCLEQEPNELVQLYVNKDAMGNINYDTGYPAYQRMSRLLYCYQVQLDHTEFTIMNTSIVLVKTSKPIIPISDYYPVSPSEIRVCVDTYVKQARDIGAKVTGTYCIMMYVVLVLSILESLTFA